MVLPQNEQGLEKSQVDRCTLGPALKRKRLASRGSKEQRQSVDGSDCEDGQGTGTTRQRMDLLLRPFAMDHHQDVDRRTDPPNRLYQSGVD